jgi:hypothetical protein
MEKQMDKIQRENNNLLPLMKENADLKQEVNLANMQVEESELQVKAL